MFDRMPPKLPFYWNSVIPATLDTALTFDEMQAKIVWTVNRILENQYLTVPYLISLKTEYTTTSISIKGILFQNYAPLQIDKEFVINGMKDGTYYINVFNDAANTDAGKPPVQSNDLLFLSTEYMPRNCTSLYVFDILNGNIVGNSIKYNDLYTEMHNADPNAHQALFEAVYSTIEDESNGLHNEIVTETNRAKQAEQQLQDNIDNESTARQQADTTLQNNINAEKTARQQADTALGERITAETTARQQADTNLQNSINAEKTARENADNALQTSIDEEISDRIDGEEATNAKIDAHIANKNNPHNVTADQIGDVVKTLNNLVNNISITGGRGTEVVTTSNSIAITGPMYDVPSNPSLDNMLNTGIYALSASVEYTTTYSGLPNKTGWLYLLVYAVGSAKKQIIYNNDGTAYRRENAQSNWLQLYSESGGGGTSGVSSINSLTGALTLNGNQGVSVTTTVNALQVSGQYYVLTQNTDVNGTLRPGVTVAGNYEFTNTPSGKTVIAIITFDYTNTDYKFAQYAICDDYSIYRRYSNADGSTATAWYENSIISINALKGNVTIAANNGNTVTKSDTTKTITITGPLQKAKSLNLNTNNTTGIFSFDYDSQPTNKPTSSTDAFIMFQVLSEGTAANQGYTQWLIDRSSGKMYIRTKNNNGSEVASWTLNSYSPAVDNQTITLDSLAVNLGVQNLTLELEEYRGTKYKAKFYVPFTVSNSNSPLTEIALWSLPEGWAFDEDQYIPLYIRSVSSGASSFGYIQCSNNAMQLIIGGTGQSIPAGWIVRFCNSDVYLVKSGA